MSRFDIYLFVALLDRLRRRVTIQKILSGGVSMRVRFELMKEARWPLLCGIALGILMAFPLAAPLMNGKILEPVATLWGSALGAAAAVTGAVWVADRQASKQRRNATALVHTMFKPIALSLVDLQGWYGSPSRPHAEDEDDDEPDEMDPDSWEIVRMLSEELISRHGELKRKIHRVEGALNLLAPSEMETVFYLEAEIENAVAGTIESVRNQASAPGHRLYPGRAKFSTRFSLMVFNEHIQDAIQSLEDAAK